YFSHIRYPAIAFDDFTNETHSENVSTIERATVRGIACRAACRSARREYRWRVEGKSWPGRLCGDFSRPGRLEALRVRQNDWPRDEQHCRILRPCCRARLRRQPWHTRIARSQRFGVACAADAGPLQ